MTAKDNKKSLDADGNIAVDFSEQLIPMTPDSKIIVKFTDLSYTMKPVNTMLYNDYQYLLHEAEGDKKKEEAARAWLLEFSLLDPQLSADDIKELPIGIFFTLFHQLMNKSFLLSTV